MADKFRNKYRIPSARAAWWDYGRVAAYFVTICTKDRRHYLGEIRDGKMHLSGCGILADVFWHEIPKHAIDVELGAFVVMPNHVHGIVILNTDNDRLDPDRATINDEIANDDAIEYVQTRHASSLTESLPAAHGSESAPRQGDSQPFRASAKNTLSSIIGGYKSVVTKHANRMGFDFAWQTRFHDHIIRNDAEYQRIDRYIENNVNQWVDDKFYKNL